MTEFSGLFVRRKTNIVKLFCATLIAGSLAACGGGGGGSSTAGTTTPPPASVTCPDGSAQATSASCALPLLTSVTPATGASGVNLDAPTAFLVDVETNGL